MTIGVSAIPARGSAAAPTVLPLRRGIGVVRAHLWLVVLLIAGVSIAVAAGPRIVLGPRVSVEAVERHTLVQSVVARGRVEAPHRVDVGVQVTGTVTRVPVIEGQVVAAGAILRELESSELRAALSQAGFAVAAAVAKSRQVREVQAPNAAQAVRQARLALDAAHAARMRSDMLLAGGAIGEATRDDAMRAEQTAAAQLARATLSYATVRTTKAESRYTHRARCGARRRGAGSSCDSRRRRRT